jgi:hypothetical protein
MQIAGVLIDVRKLVINLEIHDSAAGPDVLKLDPGRLPVRHLPVTVQAAVGIDRNWVRADVHVFVPPLAEEVAERHCNRG